MAHSGGGPVSPSAEAAQAITCDRRTLLKVVSWCLSYPDEGLLAAMTEVRAAAARAAGPAAGETLCAFFDYLEKRPLIELQEHYTAMFDMNPTASLNLTYHVMGDREERGSALAALAEMYRQAGYEPALNELPDFLPLMLEFLYELPGAEADPLVGRCLSALPAVAGSLRKNGSSYAGLLEALCGMLAAEGAPTGENSIPECARDPFSNPNRGA